MPLSLFLLTQEALAGDSPMPRLLIFAQDLELNSEQKAGAAEFVHAGGLLIGLLAHLGWTNSSACRPSVSSKKATCSLQPRRTRSPLA